MHSKEWTHIWLLKPTSINMESFGKTTSRQKIGKLLPRLRWRKRRKRELFLPDQIFLFIFRKGWGQISFKNRSVCFKFGKFCICFVKKYMLFPSWKGQSSEGGISLCWFVYGSKGRRKITKLRAQRPGGGAVLPPIRITQAEIRVAEVSGGTLIWDRFQGVSNPWGAWAGFHWKWIPSFPASLKWVWVWFCQLGSSSRRSANWGNIRAIFSQSTIWA